MANYAADCSACLRQGLKPLSKRHRLSQRWTAAPPKNENLQERIFLRV